MKDLTRDLKPRGGSNWHVFRLEPGNTPTQDDISRDRRDEVDRYVGVTLEADTSGPDSTAA